MKIGVNGVRQSNAPLKNNSKNIYLSFLMVIFFVSFITQIRGAWEYPDRFYPKFNKPTTLYWTVYHINSIPMDQRIVLISLAGTIVRKTGTPQILLWSDGGEREYFDQYKEIADAKGTPNIIKVSYSCWVFVELFKDYLSGYVVYNQGNTISAFKACNLAGVKNAIAVSTDLESTAQAFGLAKLGDADTMGELDVFNDNPGYFKYLAIYDGRESFGDTWPWNLYWYMATQGFAISAPSQADWQSAGKTAVREAIDKSYPVWGWSTGVDENQMVKPLTTKGVGGIIGGNGCSNLPVLSTMEPGEDFPYWDVLPLKITLRDLIWENNVHYATIDISDTGSTDLWWSGWTFSTDFWLHPYRTDLNRKFGVNWESPFGAMYEFNPFMLRYFKRTQTKYDSVFNGLSGAGYFYADKWGINTTTEPELWEYLNQASTDSYHAGLNIVAVMVDEGISISPVVVQPHLKAFKRLLGISYLKYSPYEAFPGELLWVDYAGQRVPTFGLNYCIWQGYYNPSDIAAVVNGDSHTGEPTSAGYYSWVLINYWSDFGSEGKGFGAAKTFADNCAAYVRIVTAEEFFLQMRLRMDTYNTLNNYLSGIKGELDELDGLTAPTQAAEDFKNQAKTNYNISMTELGGASYKNCFDDAKLADQLAERGRLSYITINRNLSELTFSVPAPMSPQYSGYFFYPYELVTDPSTMKYKVQDYYIIKWFYIEIADSTDFTNKLKTEYVTSETYTLPKYPTTVYVRVKAQGALFKDWGAWSNVLEIQSNTFVADWELYEN